MQMRKPRIDTETQEWNKNIAALKAALQEYDVARSCFGEAVEPEIIDESIYLMEAAKRKYSYFLRQVRDSYRLPSKPEF